MKRVKKNHTVYVWPNKVSWKKLIVFNSNKRLLLFLFVYLSDIYFKE